jgi:peroxiredoxin
LPGDGVTKKQIVAVGVVIALVAAAITGSRLLRNELRPVGVGVQAPDFKVATLDSVAKQKTLADYRGHVLLINIWATWCAPCRIEMPSIEELNRDFGPRGLKVIAISVDDPGMDQLVREFVKNYKLTFEVLHDPGGQEGKVSRDYQTTGYPETVIIGRDGIIRKKLLGAQNWNSPENRALIERLLAEKA